MTEIPASTPLPPPPPPPAAAARPPLRRTRDDRVIAGVCGGLGRAAGIDPVVFRVLLVVLALFGGAGILLYLAGWALIPDEGVADSAFEQFTRRHGVGVVVVLGVLAALVLVPTAWHFGSDGSWPFRSDGGLLVLIAAIAGIVWFTRRSNTTSPPAGVAPAAPAPMMASTWPPAADAGPAGQPTAPLPQGAYAPPARPYEPPLPPPPPRAPRERSALGLLTVSLAVLITGVLVAIDLTDTYNVSTVALFAAPLAVLGLGLIVGAWAGRARWLVFLAIPLALATAIASAVSQWPGDNQFESDPIAWTPTSAAGISRDYQLGAGEATLDLSQVTAAEVEAASNQPLRVELGAGELTVILPPDVTVRWSGDVRLGELAIDGDGPRVVLSGVGLAETGVSSPGAPGPALELAAQVGLGNLTLQTQGGTS